MKDFLKKNKAMVIIVLVVLIAVAWFFYSSYFSNQAVLKECKERCSYNVSNKIWKYSSGNTEAKWLNTTALTGEAENGHFIYTDPSGKDFPKQEQCIDYCLSQK